MATICVRKEVTGTRSIANLGIATGRFQAVSSVLECQPTSRTFLTSPHLARWDYSSVGLISISAAGPSSQTHSVPMFFTNMLPFAHLISQAAVWLSIRSEFGDHTSFDHARHRIARALLCCVILDICTVFLTKCKCAFHPSLAVLTIQTLLEVASPMKMNSQSGYGPISKEPGCFNWTSKKPLELLQERRPI